ncbi:uncharacterized protein LOC128293807 [Gossypium arboreum]|uniref:uncharacterized protein LOC128293807 n=1 Tax=Gossypium arboreum TaxID=29729 RepID=UPI0022F1A166|nr:uncharacterized protein LOC128293807 [Gossypium arboreum]
MTKLRVLFARLSLFDNGSLLAELQVKPMWIEQIKGKSLEDDFLVLLFRQVESGYTEDFGLNSEGVRLIRGRLKVTSNRQKSYADLKRCKVEYFIGDSVFLKVLLWKKSELPPKLDQIHDVFHLSMLRPYRSDPTHIVLVEEIEVKLDLTFEEELVQILDRDIKILRRKSIPLVKVLYCNHSYREATWEPEDAMCQQYPHLF